MAAPQLKLSYFDMPGRAELARLALSYGEIDFHDNRFQFDKWPARKPMTPLGQVPTLEVNGAVFCQSMALARYAARLSGLIPTDPLRALKMDMLSESILEPREMYSEIAWDLKDQALIAAKTKVFRTETLPRVFGFLDAQAEGPFFLGDAPTLVDLQLYDVVTTKFLPYFGDIGMSKYPHLARVLAAVQSLPTLQAHLAKLQRKVSSAT